ncbi:MAG: hypothetical protein M3O15_05900 [Acidobacteriota bacterium]|nr:hypothetical protein [Acidobacteriota bacterium]
MPARKTLVVRLILVLFSSVLSLLLAEAGVRLYFGISDEDPGDLKKKLEQSRRTPLGPGGHFSLMGLVQPSAE